MLISEMVRRANEQLAGERLTTSKMLNHLDYAIYDINQAMNADFPTVSVFAAAQIATNNTLTTDTVDYNLFPPRYIDTVVILGAARHFYMVDEEGAVATPVLDNEYGKNLFFMQRDYIHAVPKAYKDCSYNGSINHTEQKTSGTQVMELPAMLGNFWG